MKNIPCTYNTKQVNAKGLIVHRECPICKAIEEERERYKKENK